MNALDLIGRAGAAALKERLQGLGPDSGTARFMLDRLTGPQVAAIVRELVSDASIQSRVKIAVPRTLVDGQGLPEAVLTDERTVALRHAECDRPALLIANTDDDQGASLHDVALIGAKELKEGPHYWVLPASDGLGLPPEHVDAWQIALKALSSVDDWPLAQLSNYVAMTRDAIENTSLPVADALGWALPALQLPRDTGYFASQRPKDLQQQSRWRRLYDKLISDRRPLLSKQRPNRQPIESEELHDQFDAVRDEIAAALHPTIEAFIASPAGWREATEKLAELEWEQDNILLVFSGLKLKKLKLPEETIQFFDYERPDRLSDADKSYLGDLKSRSLKESREDDREFFEAHREDLAANRQLRAKWEKFIYGRPIECTDFLDGLVRSIERLFAQLGTLKRPRRIDIRSSRRTKTQWLDMNADVARAFSLKYKALPRTLPKAIGWDTPHIFEFETLLEAARKRRKFRENVSTSRANIQIKFDLTLTVGEGSSMERNTVQLIWRGEPNAIGLALPDDLARLGKNPFGIAEVSRMLVSKKGAMQSVSLADVGTLQPSFRQDAGSLVPRSTNVEDLGKTLPRSIKAAVAAGRIAPPAGVDLGEAWTAFAKSYVAAIEDWRSNGMGGQPQLDQVDLYGKLLEQLRRSAPGDLNRRDLWEPILRIGAVQIAGTAPAAIVAPWHPMRMAATAVKMRALCGLFDHLLKAEEVNFGDQRLFFADLRAEFEHAYYPEAVTGFTGGEAVLLTETSTLNDYSLMERPVRDPSEASTDVDPGEAAREIRGLIARYLDLQPHERANLSIMLYNCDTAGLPLATVNALGSVHEDEVHCNVLVRHRDRSKLNKVYTDLLDQSGSDPDAVVVSETSLNFMSKLRIGVMLEGGAGRRAADERSVDVAFLHDVVSRQAREAWFSVPRNDATDPSILDHVPPRWSYRRVIGEEQLTATSYLVSPRQPRVGWCYLDALAAVIRKQSHRDNEHYLPARQISLQDHGLEAMFKDVHGLAEWVATYDDLLDKRQLAAQGIKVIRYRRERTHGRNMVVSSTSDLRVLPVLVRRRLDQLSLGLSDDRLMALADRMIADARAISGDIILRAAKRGVSAGELIGLVLSRALVAEEFLKRPASWFLLDDYAQWLGQREEGIADILALSVDPGPEGRPRLRAIVTEAKYVEASGLSEAKRHSGQQLRQTMRRIEDALFGDPGRLDRDLWLSRLADILLDEPSALSSNFSLEEVRNGIRNGTVEIDLKGYSHVFVSGPAEATTGSSGDQDEVTEVHGLQEVYTREGLRQLIKAYEASNPLMPIRSSLGDRRPWENADFRVPAPRLRWTTNGGPSKGPGRPGSDDNGTPPTPSSPPLPPSGAVKTSVADTRVAPPPSTGPAEQTAEKTSDQLSSGSSESFAALVSRRAGQIQSEAGEDDQWLEATASRLRTALMGYNLQAKIAGMRLTPNAALVRFLGSDRLRVEDIEAKQSALLTTHGLRLISVSPLPGEIVVGVARPKRQIVSMWDLWARRAVNRNAAGLNTSFLLGLRELDGEILYLNLGGPFAGASQHDPHTLIAGATGSGKSVLIQALILDIAATNPSALVHIHLIDPKMGVDYSAIERLPHVKGGIVIDQSAAIEMMDGLVVEMDRRYELFRQSGARDIRSFNIKVAPEERLPMKFLVHDEFAEWMLTEDYKGAVTSIVSRLGVKARAAGIHLVFAAQRPDAGVMPVQLRDNLGNRLILKVASVGTSEIALGMKGAENLLGLGHLAARLSGEASIVFAQAPFLSDDDIEDVVSAIAAQDA
ncbi:S-DNA-T family DNA segregation ATPase FtsK/SpoIIIE [Mesorhizobium sp. YL-MeA3-2017]|uniref:FtsK/SpoIIIE domain-containing protein n=1 Tax=Mesorhizobium sp. YL-MeA3-2017 TaxID=3042284 RepID=UPI0015CBF640|nr:FtsK/SpoIIIE domain-containing protein [Mesorhizobium sp. YL-MeA3-2017]MDQ0333043.1 S-DNA-T family DNA segregation ATPase FtsK/SpoIIIE [Mesorhizobium sp. YL-MeA3-2017]